MISKQFVLLALTAAALITPIHSLYGASTVTTTINVPNAAVAKATRVNGQGATAGIYLDENGNAGAFVEQSGAVSTFAAPDGSDPNPTAINSNDDVVGYYVLTVNVVHGFLRHSNGTVDKIDPPGSVTSCPRALTDNGVIAGVFTSADGKAHAYILKNGVYKTIDYPGAVSTTIADMNSSGDAAGNWIDSQANVHGYLLSGSGRFTSVDPPGAVTAQVTSIDAHGNITGFYTNAGGRKLGFMRAQNGIFQTLAPPRSTSADAVGFLNNGAVVGMASIQSTPGALSFNSYGAYIWESKGDYVSVSLKYAKVTVVKGSNASGWAAGLYVDQSDTPHAFKLQLLP
jgi:hypothetical protein